MYIGHDTVVEEGEEERLCKVEIVEGIQEQLTHISNYKITQKHNLKTQTLHANNPYYCDQCDKQVKWKTLNDHMISVH